MTVVADASVVVAALVDVGPDGGWADHLLAAHTVVAPALMPAEVANVLRRAAIAGLFSDDVASLAHADLLQLPVQLFPYEPLAERVWELRATLTSYDAWYVALAETLDVPLATLDARLRRAPRLRCAFATP